MPSGSSIQPPADESRGRQTVNPTEQHPNGGRPAHRGGRAGDAHEGAPDDQRRTSGTRILGSLRSADGKGVVRMEDRFDADIDDLWSALTDPRRLARWMARSRATCAWAASSARAFLPADGKAPGAWKRASPRGGCWC